MNKIILFILKAPSVDWFYLTLGASYCVVLVI